MHNGISRLYETFGNGGADTEKRILQPEEYSRTWYRSESSVFGRDVVAARQQQLRAVGAAEHNSTSHNTHHFLENYYTKSKRSIEKPTLEGPAAYVIPADAADTNREIELLKVMNASMWRLSN